MTFCTNGITPALPCSADKQVLNPYNGPLIGYPLYYTEGVAHWVCSCVSVYCSLIHAFTSGKLHRLMGLTHRPPHGGGGHSAWCAWLAKELDHPLHHACEFSARLMGGRMLEILCFSLTRQNHLDVRSIFDLETPR